MYLQEGKEILALWGSASFVEEWMEGKERRSPEGGEGRGPRKNTRFHKEENPRSKRIPF